MPRPVDSQAGFSPPWATEVTDTTACVGRDAAASRRARSTRAVSASSASRGGGVSSARHRRGRRGERGREEAIERRPGPRSLARGGPLDADDEHLFGARGADVEEPHRLGLLERPLGLLHGVPAGGRGQILLSARAELLHDPEVAGRRVAFPVDPEVARRKVVGRRFREKNDRRLESLGPVQGHQADDARPSGLDAHLFDEVLVPHPIDLADDAREIEALRGELPRGRQGLEQISGAARTEILGGGQRDEAEPAAQPRDRRRGRKPLDVGERLAKVGNGARDPRVGRRGRFGGEPEPAPGPREAVERVVVDAEDRAAQGGDEGDGIVRIRQRFEQRA